LIFAKSPPFDATNFRRVPVRTVINREDGDESEAQGAYPDR
jgi:hypothetical protein